MNSLERDFAQGECFTFLNLVGVGRKNVDAIICNRCHSTIIKSTARGIADYNATVAGCGLVVEVKAGRERFNFAELRLDQRTWLRHWMVKAEGIAWVWLQLGSERVNAKDYPRTAFLMPFHILTAIRRRVRFEGNSKSLALNELAASTRKLETQKKLWATNLLNDYRLEWKGNGLWMPNEDHLFFRTYGGYEYLVTRKLEAQNVHV